VLLDLFFHSEQDKENDIRNAQATQAVIQRRRRPKRRSTGVVHVDMDVRMIFLVLNSYMQDIYAYIVGMNRGKVLLIIIICCLSQTSLWNVILRTKFWLQCM
jgi:hypothetical protein